MVGLLSTFAELYFEFLETIAVSVAVLVFGWKCWRAGSSIKFESGIEAMLSAILIPSGLAFLIAAFDPADLLPKLQDAHVALVVGGCALIYLGVTGALK